MSNKITKFEKRDSKTEITRDLSYLTGNKKYRDKEVCIGIPAYDVKDIIDDALCSIMIQTVRDDILIVISPDDDTDYSYLKDRYPLLYIEILPNPEKNGGPGIARDRVIEYLDTLSSDDRPQYVYFMDADDVIFNPYVIEGLLLKAYKFPQSVMIQGVAVQELDADTYRRMGGLEPRLDQRTGMVANPDRYTPQPFLNPSHPWTFNRLISVEFILKNDIRFSELRQMEDFKMTSQIRMLSDGSNRQTVRAGEVGYVWRTAVSDHSITRIGIKENGGIPLYNFNGCSFGATISFIDSLYLVRKKKPLTQNIALQIAQHMTNQYVTLIECIDEKPLFAAQAWFNAKRFYRTMFQEIEGTMTEDFLFSSMTQAYMQILSKNPEIRPKYTFDEFMEIVKTEPYGGIKEWHDIRKEIPQWVKDLDKKSGTFGDPDIEYTYSVPDKENGEDSYTNLEDYNELYDLNELEWQKL